MLERGLPKFTLLNVNVPLGASKGFQVTVQAKRNHVTVVCERMDPAPSRVLLDRGRREPLGAAGPSDYQAVRDGYVSITPLQPDMTAYDALAYVRAG